MTELRNRHARGEVHAGINVRRGEVSDMLAENVVQPLLVTSSALTLATECVRMILKVPPPPPPAPHPTPTHETMHYFKAKPPGPALHLLPRTVDSGGISKDVWGQGPQLL